MDQLTVNETILSAPSTTIIEENDSDISFVDDSAIGDPLELLDGNTSITLSNEPDISIDLLPEIIEASNVLLPEETIEIPESPPKQIRPKKKAVQAKPPPEIPNIVRKIPRKIKDDNQIKFNCKDCFKAFSSATALSAHFQFCIVQLTCKDCNTEFESPQELLTHSSTCKAHKKVLYQCPKCIKQFSNGIDFELHLKVVHNLKIKEPTTGLIKELEPKVVIQKKVVQLKSVPKKIVEKEKTIFPTTKLYITRKTLLTEKPVCVCEACNKVFSSHYYLKYHQTKCPKFLNKNQTCKCIRDGCSETFSQEHELITHLQEHLVTNCEGCGIDFPDKESLNDHFCVNAINDDGETTDDAEEGRGTFISPIQNRTKSFECSDCSIKFLTSLLLEKHRTEVHNESLDCKICQKSFTSQRNLQRHKAVEHENGQTIQEATLFSCDQCDLDFISDLQLRKHLSIKHFHGLLYHCSFGCGVSFRSEITWKQHETAHQPKKCAHCHKTFKTLNALKLHEAACPMNILKIIPPPKNKMILKVPRSCPVCNKSFVILTLFNAHKLKCKAISPPVLTLPTNSFSGRSLKPNPKYEHKQKVSVKQIKEEIDDYCMVDDVDALLESIKEEPMPETEIIQPKCQPNQKSFVKSNQTVQQAQNSKNFLISGVTRSQLPTVASPMKPINQLNKFVRIIDSTQRTPPASKTVRIISAANKRPSPDAASESLVKRLKRPFFNCTICMFSCVHEEMLEKHIELQHKKGVAVSSLITSSSVFQCQFCGEKVRSAELMKEHVNQCS